jgi:adenylate cyclase, class 2
MQNEDSRILNLQISMSCLLCALCVLCGEFLMYEVEQKHLVTDVRDLEEHLAERGVQIGPSVAQSDQYFAHPSRDFAQTDEALRIRTVGDRSFVTFKGPKLDTTTKTRRELELPLAESDADGSKFAELLQLLGFKPVAVVRKRRRKFEIKSHGRCVEGALDEVANVGMYAELELQADEAGLDAAKRTISKLATELELGPSERRSYLEMLLENIAKLAAN